MADKVRPDVRRYVDDSALYDRETILRVIDEEVAEINESFDAMEVDPWNVDEHRHRIDTLRSLRARFAGAE